MNRRDTVTDLAPRPPPCFLNRAAWVEYLQAAAQAQGDSEPKILLIAKGEARINYDYPFCDDCDEAFKARAGSKCQPNFLKDQAP